MSDRLAFNLAEMENLYLEASKYEKSFRSGIQEMDKIVEEIGTMWTSGETGTYENFKQWFKQKLPALNEGDDYMKTFCNKVEEKRNDFEGAAKRENNSMV